MRKSFVSIEHARSQEQIDVMKRIEADGVCPFCMEHFLKYHPKPILHENENWIITENMVPYEGSVHHYLIVHKTHISFPQCLSDRSRIELFDTINWAIQKLNLLGGGILLRFGDMNITGGSVDHLHAHLIVGDKDSGENSPLRVKIGYKKTA